MDKRLYQLIDLTDFEQLFKLYNYSFFTKGDYNVNIIGIRNLIDGTAHTNTFNDALVLLYKVNDKWIKKVYEFTTDPGQSMLNTPQNTLGCSILVPSQYRSIYKIDLHSGKYKALCQRLGPVAVYRDNNKDKRLDFDATTIDVGMFGINIHRAKPKATVEVINGYSAGCQVFKDGNSFDEFMQIITEASDRWGNKFTYSLITTDMM